MTSRFTWKLKAKERYRFHLVRKLLNNSTVSSFCFYQQRNEPHNLHVYIKLNMKSRSSILGNISKYIQGKPYAPKKIVKNLFYHFSHRNEFVLYKREDDPRQEDEVKKFINDWMIQDKKSLLTLLLEAESGGDTELFLNLLANWKQYKSTDNVLHLIRNKNFQICNNNS